MHEYNHPRSYLCFSYEEISTHKSLTSDRHMLHLVHFTFAVCYAGWLVACVIKDKLTEINHCCVGAQSCRSAKFCFVN